MRLPFPMLKTFRIWLWTVPCYPKPVLSTVRLPTLPLGSSNTHLLSSLVAIAFHKQFHVCGQPFACTAASTLLPVNS